MHTKIKTHKPGKQYAQPHFFILNKGLNSGKPLSQSCPNCFVCLVQTEEEKDYFFSLLYGLWRSNAFHILLKGSVIPFITLSDLKEKIQKSHALAQLHPHDFQKSVKTIRTLDELEKMYRQNLNLIEDARKAVFYKYLRHR